jgi:glycine/D-amino acid oxidase-like deaminating enzyme
MRDRGDDSGRTPAPQSETRADVLVVGGGLAGAATAYYLAKEGVDVLLLEQHADLNTQASGSNAGSIHAQIAHEPFLAKGEAWGRAYAATIPLMLASIRVWSGLEAGARRGPGVLPPRRPAGGRDRRPDARR